jgi:anthranilate phosphoribosyltransferase
LKDGEVFDYSVTPAQFGIDAGSLEALRVESAAQSLAMLKSALAGETGAPYDMVALNAGATIYAGDLAESLEAGVEQARELLDSGAALRKLEELAAFSRRFSSDE